MKRLISVITAAALMFGMCGCNVNRDTKEESDALISFTDDDGRKIELDKPAERIISLYSAHTENLYYLDAQSTLIGGYKTWICMIMRQTRKL